MQVYPKRLIEVDLPIKRISAHARREKSIRHGHISTLHIWWARRPLAACRAVICAALWPDPADPLCPKAFREKACDIIQSFARTAAKDNDVQTICSEESWGRWVGMAKAKEDLNSKKPEHMELLRYALLDFIADFSAWEASTSKCFLETARGLTQAAHEALGGAPGTRPLVVDPFAGGGSIPLEALRSGADAFASDLNPVAVLLNKIVLEYIPKHGQRLSDAVGRWGKILADRAKKDLLQFYPCSRNGARPVGYIWARTIRCEGPGCGVEIPLIRSLWIARKNRRSVALKLLARPKAKRVDLEIIEDATASEVGQGTAKRGSGTCPVCGFTTTSSRVRLQLGHRHGGAADSRLLVVVEAHPDHPSVSYRLADSADLAAVEAATKAVRQMSKRTIGDLPPVPDETYPDVSGAGALSSSVLYGVKTWGDLFSPRQALVLTTFAHHIHDIAVQPAEDQDLLHATVACLACAVSKLADYLSSLCVWRTARSCAAHTFGRQALPMAWDYAEMSPFAGSAGDWDEAIRYLRMFIEDNASAICNAGTVERASATTHPLPDDSAHAVITDPPYYDAIAYGDLSNFFYVWLRRMLGSSFPGLFRTNLVDTTDEVVHMSKRFSVPYAHKTKEFFEERMTQAMTEARRVLHPSGIGVVVFAHKSTAGWEAMLQAMIDAGWVMSGSWSIDTERGGRLNSNDTASLASSVHIVCRPRELASGKLEANSVGDWREVLQELPTRVSEWMPRLAAEGVVGADAIFACLGPALEVFSRYSRVEKASGEQVTLREYLEQVWAAVSKEALNMIFTGADATGFEEDARLTAMWLWTLTASRDGNGQADEEDETAEGEDDDQTGGSSRGGSAGVYSLEYDAARKIAQGLGAHLDKLAGMVEVKGESARLLSVSERTRALFGKDQAAAPSGKRQKKKDKQMDLGFAAELEAAETGSGGWGDKSVSKVGQTVLDRLHQAMILFAAGRGEALRRFLVEDGVGRDQRLWRLAQALSALYPPGTDEKRWVDGVLARKKGLGL